MKKIILSIVALVALVVLPMSVKAQVSVTENVDTKAKIIAPIAITQTAATKLDFGTITKNAAANEVSVSVANARTSTVANTLLASGPSSVPEFTVTGEEDQAYTVTLPADDAITLSNGAGGTMKLKSFIHNAAETLNGATETFKVGATLKVGAAQASGEYTATFDVTVAYD